MNKNISIDAKNTNSCSRLYEAIKTNSIGYIYAISLIIISFLLLIFRLTNNINTDNWANIWDPIISVFTIITASLATLIAFYTNWKLSLEKRITNIFVYCHKGEANIKKEDFTKLENLKSEIQKIEDELKSISLDNSFFNKRDILNEKIKQKKDIEGNIDSISKKNMFYNEMGFQKDKNYVLMICFEALLAGESDIRQWTQQIGKQMSENEYLEFYPFYLNGKNEILKVKVNNKNRYINHHIVLYFLSAVPKVIIKGKNTIIWDDNYENTTTNRIHKMRICEIDNASFYKYADIKQWIVNNNNV